ncbi:MULTISPECIES: phosphotransferase [unclassified Kribbella]|uniref:phosphotransferase enzyme family protein n=1 Tax=unclassified Kribbella TaxID=2644121 RepID=UPI0033E2D2B6
MEELLKAWGVRASDVRAAGEGTNNTTFFVGDEFVLRIHRNTTVPDYEHAVLRALDGLSFAVPVPVPADDGSTVVRREVDGDLVTASLSRRIPGEHPRRGDVVQAEACGAALAELDEALARLDPQTLPPRDEWDGDLTKVHRRVPDPGELIASLEGAVRREQVRWIFAAVQQQPDLPRSIIHADFFPTNVLMDGSRVTAILDFEVAGPMYRALDLSVGMAAFDPADAFRRGYLARLPLTEAERRAVPELQLLREATSLVHWYGRHLDGLTTAADISARADRLLELERRTAAREP